MSDTSWTRWARRGLALGGMALAAGCGGMSEVGDVADALDVIEAGGGLIVGSPGLEDDPGWASAEVAAAERLDFDGIVDGVRLDNGEGTLALNDQLNQASQDYAGVLNETPGQLSHTGPDGSTPGDRALAAGYDYQLVGENLAYGPTSNEQVVGAWMASPSHRETMLNPDVEDVGLGREGLTWVMMVGQPASD